MLFSLFTLINDPLAPVQGEIEQAAGHGMSIMSLLIIVACGIAVLVSAYDAFFGDAGKGLSSFFITLVIASIVSAITVSLG